MAQMSFVLLSSLSTWAALSVAATGDNCKLCATFWRVLPSDVHYFWYALPSDVHCRHEPQCPLWQGDLFVQQQWDCSSCANWCCHSTIQKSAWHSQCNQKTTISHPISSITLAVDMPVGDGLSSGGRLSISKMTVKGPPCSGVGSCAAIGISVGSCAAVGTTDVGSCVAVGGIAVRSCTAVRGSRGVVLLTSHNDDCIPTNLLHDAPECELACPQPSCDQAAYVYFIFGYLCFQRHIKECFQSSHFHEMFTQKFWVFWRSVLNCYKTVYSGQIKTI